MSIDGILEMFLLRTIDTVICLSYVSWWLFRIYDQDKNMFIWVEHDLVCPRGQISFDFKQLCAYIVNYAMFHGSVLAVAKVKYFHGWQLNC